MVPSFMKKSLDIHCHTECQRHGKEGWGLTWVNRGQHNSHCCTEKGPLTHLEVMSHKQCLKRWIEVQLGGWRSLGMGFSGEGRATTRAHHSWSLMMCCENWKWVQDEWLEKMGDGARSGEERSGHRFRCLSLKEGWDHGQGCSWEALMQRCVCWTGRIFCNGNSWIKADDIGGVARKLTGLEKDGGQIHCV